MSKTKLVQINPDALARAGALGMALAAYEPALTGLVPMLVSEPEHEAPFMTAAVTTEGKARPKDLIGLVRITGPLLQRASMVDCAFVDGYDGITARLDRALADDSVSSVLLVLDSPGGSAAGLGEAVTRMRGMVERSGKPVVAYVDELAASAAYWLAIGVADEVHLPESGRVGSIGCIGGWVDESKAWEQKGVAFHVMRWPEGKAESMPQAPLAKLADERSLAHIRAMGEMFMSAVAEKRGLKLASVRDFQAALYSGNTAVKEGLADRVGTLESAVNRAAELGTERRAKRQKESEMSLQALVTGLLGLPEGSTVEACAEALSKVAAGFETSTGEKTLPGALAEVDRRVEKAVTEHAALVAFRKAEADAKAAEEASALTAEQEQEAAALAALEQAGKDGKIDPARKAGLIEKSKVHGSAWLLALVAEMQPQVINKEIAATIKTPDTRTEAISAELAAELKRMGITKEQHLEAQKAMAESKSAGEV